MVNFGLCDELLPDGTKPLPALMITYCKLDPEHQISDSDILIKIFILYQQMSSAKQHFSAINMLS